MVYLPWGPREILLANSYEYYSYTRTVAYLHELLRYIIDTPIKTFNASCPRRDELRCDPPIDRLGRKFIEGEFYLCEVHGTWKVEYDLLQLAVSVLLDQKRCDRAYPFFRTRGAAEKYVIEKIDVLLKLTRSYKMNQQEFERVFGLSWVDEEAMTRNDAF
ncbi:unnamed protein product [Mucor hiemalis]